MSATFTNDPTKAGQSAGKPLYSGLSRYKATPIHTRFDAVEWFVTDAEQEDELGLPLVVRQAATLEEAKTGLDWDE